MTESVPPTTDAVPPRVRTLSDLARLAGVSPGTVSRALAGKDLVKKDTRERIQALAREHGFRPNQTASNLRTQRTGVVGVVIPLGHDRSQHISDPFFMTLLGHLADQLTERGYDLMLSRAIPDDNADWLDRIAFSGMVDGVILIGQSNQVARIDAVAERYEPMVVWGAHEEGLAQCVVGTDNFLGGEMAAAHLVERGAVKLRFLGDTTGLEIAQRYSGARAAAEVDGVSLKSIDVRLSTEVMDEDIERWLTQEKEAFDGVVAASDLIALAAIRALRKRGMSVPNQVQVVGYDDLPLATQTMPSLTTVRQDIKAGAKRLVDNLFLRIEGVAQTGDVIVPELIARGSTKTD